MAENSKRRVSEKVQEIKAIITKEIKTLIKMEEEAYSQYLGNSHGVYRNELKQLKSEIEMKQLNFFIRILQKIQDTCI